MRLLPGLKRRGKNGIIVGNGHRIEGIRFWESSGTTNIEEANEWYIERRRELREWKLFKKPPDRTFAEACAKYVGECQKQSLARDILSIDAVMPYIGHRNLSEIHDGTLQSFKQDRLRRVAASTVNRDIWIVKRVLTLCARLWRDERNLPWLQTVPMLLNVQGVEKLPYPLTREEQRLFLSKLPEHLVKMCTYALNTGCREQEVCQLKWAWLREKDGIHFVSLPSQVTKNARSRPIVLNSAVRNLLNGMPARSECVFTYRDAAIKKMHGSAWKRAWKQAGLPISSDDRKGVHNLSHTVAQRLRDNGVP